MLEAVAHGSAEVSVRSAARSPKDVDVFMPRQRLASPRDFESLEAAKHGHFLPG